MIFLGFGFGFGLSAAPRESMMKGSLSGKAGIMFTLHASGEYVGG